MAMYWDGNADKKNGTADEVTAGEQVLAVAKVDTGRSRGWGQGFNDFCQSTTLHGMNKVVEKSPSTLRKAFWLGLVLTGFGLFSYQVVDRVLHFVSYPVTVNVKINYNKTLRFPAITICNQNAFRITEAANQNWYHWLDDLYSQSDSTEFDYRKYGVGNVSRLDLFTQTAHRKSDLVYECSWDGRACSVDNFTRVLTDHGVCYTFNSGQKTPVLTLSKTGAERGLKLKLNVEQYQYMRGPHDAAGLKMLLHDQREIPFVRDLGEAIPTGSNAFIGVGVLQVDNLPSPHGDCEKSKHLKFHDTYSLSACRRECVTRFVAEHCGCSDFYMPVHAHDDASYQFLLETKEKEVCDCPVPCSTTHYLSSTSYATTTSRNTHQLLMDKRSRDLGVALAAARETEQRMDEAIIQKDTLQITSLHNAFAHVVSAMTKLETAVGSIHREHRAIIEEIKPRVWFHDVKGVERTSYTAEHDFARGWEVMDERTIMHTTTGYHQLTEAFRTMVDVNMASVDSDPAMRQVYFISTKRDLELKHSLVSRALYNFTEVHMAFTNGTPILTYRASPDRRYDMSYISLPLLHFNKREPEYANDVFRYLACYKTNLETLMGINQEVYQNATVDSDLLDSTLEGVQSCARGINYRRFLYADRVVLGLTEYAKQIWEDFNGLNKTLHSSAVELDRSLDSIKSALQEFLNSSWERISRVVEKSRSYLTGKNISKLELADLLGSDEMREDLGVASVVFSDIRLRTQQAEDRWFDFQRAFEAVWRSMLENIHLEEFYQMIHDDVTVVFTAADNSTDRDYVSSILAQMIYRKQEVVLNLSIEQAHLFFNSDFATMDKKAKYEEIAAMFDTIISRNSPSSAMGPEGDTFLSHMGALRASMVEYVESTVINDAFYKANFLDINVYIKDMSYEEVQQQAAYDVISLLSDIGGFMGLAIGASIITIFEIFDAIIQNVCRKQRG